MIGYFHKNSLDNVEFQDEETRILEIKTLHRYLKTHQIKLYFDDIEWAGHLGRYTPCLNPVIKYEE